MQRARTADYYSFSREIFATRNFLILVCIAARAEVRFSAAHSIVVGNRSDVTMDRGRGAIERELLRYLRTYPGADCLAQRSTVPEDSGPLPYLGHDLNNKNFTYKYVFALIT